MIPEVTRAIGVARVAGIEYPMGMPLGRAGDAEGQRAVLRATLAVLERAEGPDWYEELQFRWPESPAEVRAKYGHEDPPVAKLLKRKPWLLPYLFRAEAPE